MIINHNLNAMSAHRNMNVTNTAQGKAMEKLSSGLRINRAGDDAAGLAISEKMRSQIRGLQQASRNAQDGISMIQTAEGALSETQAIGQRMRELAVQSANGTYTDEDRELIDREFQQLRAEIDRISTDTEFNGSKVLNGSMSGKEFGVTNGVELEGNDPSDSVELSQVFTNAEETKKELTKIGEGNFELKIYVGEDGKSAKIDLIDDSDFNGRKKYVMDSVTITEQSKETPVKLGGAKINIDMSKLKQAISTTENRIDVSFSNVAHKEQEGIQLQIGANQEQYIGFSIENMRSRELGLGGVDILTQTTAQEAISQIDNAVSRVSEERAKMGAIQNRLEHTIVSTDNTAENLQASESRIRDVDMAKEMMNLTKLNVLQQASQAMLSQANQAPQQVLQLLK